MLTPVSFALALLLYAVPCLAAGTDNEACLRCHGVSSMARQQGSRLYIDPNRFAATTHARIGCASCHADVSPAHPGDRARPSKASCVECHAPVQAEYLQGRHAQRAACADCHDPHRVRSSTASSGVDLNRPCARCHERNRIVDIHAAWLPQTPLHLDALPCITCHTGSKQYVIKLYLESRQGRSGQYTLASHRELSRLAPGSEPQARLGDPNDDRLVSLPELRDLNQWSKSRGLRVTAMLVPKQMSHKFQTLESRWDCSFCHASGPKSSQESYLCLPDRDGSYSQIPVARGAILGEIYGTPDFYMMGATRSKTLDMVGGLIILGGLMMPLGHGTLRFLSRHNREER